jgi:hypothetical protein
MLTLGRFAGHVSVLAFGVASPSGRWGSGGLRGQRRTRTVSLGTGLSCLADRHVAGQPLSIVARE